MQDIVVTLVFSIVMLMFMAFPAMKIARNIGHKMKFSPKTESILTILLTIILSIAAGVFLRFF